ncbi:MAG: LacI family DNA-binding transcriptional regulator [Bacteroidota bacterium]
MGIKSGKPTIHDIARQLELNPSTVSRALNNHKAVSKRTRELVHAKARAMNYQPNHIAAALRKGRSKILGIIVPFTGRYFFANIITGIEEAANQQAYRVVVTQSHEDSAREAELVQTLLRMQVDGLLISRAKFGQFDPNLLKQIQDNGVGIQFFDNLPMDLEVAGVLIDDYRGGYLATKHLIEGGYRRIAHLRGSDQTHIYQDRFRGYRDALQDAGLDQREDWVVPIVSNVEDGRAALEKLWQGAEKPDAIFSSSDFAAVGCLQKAREMDIAVPQDLGVVGFANEPFTELVTPTLSSIDQQTRSIGSRAAERLLAALNNPTEAAPDHLVLLPELIVRESSRRS